MHFILLINAVKKHLDLGWRCIQNTGLYMDNTCGSILLYTTLYGCHNAHHTYNVLVHELEDSPL